MGIALLLGAAILIAGMSSQSSSTTITPGKSVSKVQENLLTSPFLGVSNVNWVKYVNVFTRLYGLKQGWEPSEAILKEIGMTAVQFKASTTGKVEAIRGMAKLFYKLLSKKPLLNNVIGHIDKKLFPYKVTTSGMFGVIYSEGLKGAERIFIEGVQPKQRTKVLFKLTNGIF